jgi:hypothetical protein
VVAHWSRVLHTYLSMASFSILFFFAATGITLNHQDRMNGEPSVARHSGRLDDALVRFGAPVDQARIVDRLRGAHRHKGRDTGPVWAQIIDLSAILMMLVSITGLTLIFFLHKRLALGLWMLAIGTAVCVAVYAWFVY